MVILDPVKLTETAQHITVSMALPVETNVSYCCEHIDNSRIIVGEGAGEG